MTNPTHIGTNQKAGSQKSVRTTAQNDHDKIIQIKRCANPSEDLQKNTRCLKNSKVQAV